MPASIQLSTTTVTSIEKSTSSIYRPKKQQKTMSLTQTYSLAYQSRQKLSKEASRPDHDLRLLVGHANMLDALMMDLANAKQEQEWWFNHSVSGAEDTEDEEQHVETVVEEPEADWLPEEADSSDDESDYDEEGEKPTTQVTTMEVELSDDEEDFSDHSLTRINSRHSPPELSSDSESEDSEDDHMPPSPPLPTIAALTEKQRQGIATTSYYDSKEPSLSPTEQESFEQQGFFLPSRQQPTIIAAY